MRKIIVSEFVTLDGVMEAPETWQFPYYSDDMGEVIKAQILASDAMLLGRVTYEVFAAYWPSQTNNEFGIADKLNSSPKFVVSSTLQKAEWNNSTLIKGNVAEEISKLKQQPDGNIRITGSATLVQSLMQADLIDEYQLMVHPVVLGSGKRLFRDGSDTLKLKLLDTKTFSKGVVLLCYQPAGKEPKK
jgi:dihydrofolate reductase